VRLMTVPCASLTPERYAAAQPHHSRTTAVAPPLHSMPAVSEVQPAGGARKSTSQQEKANLKFPVARLKRQLKLRPGAKQIGTTGSVYFAAIVEYMIAELCEVTKERMKNRQHDAKLTSPEDLRTAIRCDDELQHVFRGVRMQIGDKVKGVRKSLMCRWDKEQLAKKQEEARQNRPPAKKRVPPPKKKKAPAA
jgi:histone H2A